MFLRCLRQAFDEGRLQFHGQMAGLARPAAFTALCNRMKRIQWNVYAKAPFGGPEQVLKYLARYTHRVAISNSRILSIEGGKVTFLWKDYADGDKVKPMTVDAVEFIRRFLLHILPAGFVRIRHFGFLANRARRDKLELCRALLGAPSAPPCSPLTDAMDRKTDEKLCPVCTTGHMRLIRLTYTEWAAAPPIRIDSS
jgi:Putative transposase